MTLKIFHIIANFALDYFLQEFNLQRQPTDKIYAYKVEGRQDVNKLKLHSRVRKSAN